MEIRGSTNTTELGEKNTGLTTSEDVQEYISKKPREEKTPLEDLEDILTNKIKEELDKGADISISHQVFDDMIQFLLDNLEIILNKEKLTLKEITDIYLSSLYELMKDEDLNISKFDPYQQFLPETLYYLCDLVAEDNNLLDFMNIEYWKKDILRNISDVEGNSDLLFSIMTLIAFLNLIKNKNKRIEQLKK